MTVPVYICGVEMPDIIDVDHHGLVFFAGMPLTCEVCMQKGRGRCEDYCGFDLDYIRDYGLLPWFVVDSFWGNGTAIILPGGTSEEPVLVKLESPKIKKTSHNYIT